MIGLKKWLTSAGQWTSTGKPTAGFVVAGSHDVAMSLWRTSGLTIMLLSMYLLPQQAGKLDAGCYHILKYVAKLLEQAKLPFIIHGDWNVDPTTLRASGWPALIGGEVLTTKSPTITTGSEINYFVVAKSPSPAVGTATVVTGPWRPHFGLELVVYQRPRELMVSKLRRQPKLPLALGPDLPWHVFQ